MLGGPLRILLGSRRRDRRSISAATLGALLLPWPMAAATSLAARAYVASLRPKHRTVVEDRVRLYCLSGRRRRSAFDDGDGLGRARHRAVIWPFAGI
jgi:hypothetical protein